MYEYEGEHENGFKVYHDGYPTHEQQVHMINHQVVLLMIISVLISFSFLFEIYYWGFLFFSSSLKNNQIIGLFIGLSDSLSENDSHGDYFITTSFTLVAIILYFIMEGIRLGCFFSIIILILLLAVNEFSNQHVLFFLVCK